MEERTRELQNLNAKLEAEIRERSLVEQQLLQDKVYLQYLLSGHERDRQLIAYEIHDGIVQGLTAAMMHLEMAPGQIDQQRIDTALRILRGSVSEARRVMKGLSPPLLEDIGVIAAIEGMLEEQVPESCEIKFEHDVQFDRLLPLLECTIYRVVQESVANILRHSKAKHATIRLIEEGERLILTVEDDGVGFDAGNVPATGFGLKGIAERAKLFDVEAKIDSRPGAGTRLTIDFPRIRANQDFDKWNAISGNLAGQKRV
ncbi:Signal transduction histidine-protein kinase/phosphatase DegS [Blastopirellula retiformator]|uniref:histidine kinase n=2 Tax=Blastopirellula retiformator TaxID=2527970 RepID=A0A5C5V9Q4_9BACT|nr:Signal transduction histidine-protein kinase/phosphatase DegS [Blastopirellula retiformator]